jgi:hypothetical protein
MYDLALATRDYSYESKLESGATPETFNRTEAVEADLVFHRVRLLDDDARDLVGNFRTTARAYAKSGTKQAQDDMRTAHTTANERLGTIYRQLLQNP